MISIGRIGGRTWIICCQKPQWDTILKPLMRVVSGPALFEYANGSIIVISQCKAILCKNGHVTEHIESDENWVPMNMVIVDSRDQPPEALIALLWPRMFWSRHEGSPAPCLPPMRPLLWTISHQTCAQASVRPLLGLAVDREQAGIVHGYIVGHCHQCCERCREEDRPTRATRRPGRDAARCGTA